MDRINEILSLLENPADLSDETVAELHSELTDLFAAVRTGEVEGVEPTDLATLTSIRDGILNLAALAHDRMTAAEAVNAQIAELEASLAATPDEPVVEEPEPEPVVEPEVVAEVVEETVVEPEPVAASIPSVTRVAQRANPTPPRPTEPTVNHHYEHQGNQVTFEQVMERMRAGIRSGAGVNDRFNLRVHFPDERRLSGGPEDIERIYDAQRARQDPSSWSQDAPLTAAMWCAPAEVIYDYPVISDARRPVRDSLVSFNLTRGSVQIPTPVTLADIDIAGSDAAVSIYTDTEFDAGTDKPIQDVTCPSPTTVSVYAVTKRLRFSNMMEMSYPENLRNFNDLATAAQARMAEGRLLTRMKALSTAKTEAVSFGASRDLIEAIKRAGAQIDSVHRSNVMKRVWLPFWAATMGEADLVRALNSDPAFITEATRIFEGGVRDAGVNVTWYLDTPDSGTSQILEIDAGAQLDAFPTTIQWGIAPEGTFLYLDEGSLDFGVTRDTTTNKDNRAEIFAETFENVAKVGPGALWVSQAVCHDGTSGAGVDVNVCLGS